MSTSVAQVKKLPKALLKKAYKAAGHQFHQSRLAGGAVQTQAAVDAAVEVLAEEIGRQYAAELLDSLAERLGYTGEVFDELSLRTEAAKLRDIEPLEDQRLEPLPVDPNGFPECPTCGGTMVKRDGKFGPFLACAASQPTDNHGTISVRTFVTTLASQDSINEAAGRYIIKHSADLTRKPLRDQGFAIMHVSEGPNDDGQPATSTMVVVQHCKNDPGGIRFYCLDEPLENILPPAMKDANLHLH